MSNAIEFRIKLPVEQIAYRPLPGEDWASHAERLFKLVEVQDVIDGIYGPSTLEIVLLDGIGNEQLRHIKGQLVVKDIEMEDDVI
jgi:hypothetical protein